MTPDVSLRAADRSELEALTAAFLRGGHSVTALDSAGRVVGVATEDLPDLALPMPVPKPAATPKPAPAAPVAEQAPEQGDVLAELRAIRVTAEALTARLDALLAGGGA
ncbi:MAG TPA: hypothetical protein VIZ86_16580 [Pseudomonas sp.]